MFAIIGFLIFFIIFLVSRIPVQYEQIDDLHVLSMKTNTLDKTLHTTFSNEPSDFDICFEFEFDNRTKEIGGLYRHCIWKLTQETESGICLLMCRNASILFLNPAIEQYTYNCPSTYECNHEPFELELHNIWNWPDDKISTNWYTADTESRKLGILLLDLPEIIAIEKDAFKSTLFTKIYELTLMNMNVKTLTANILNGLDELTSLTLDNMPIEEISSGILIPVKKNLNQLQIRNLNKYPLDLYNITGNVILEKLILVDISNCLIPTLGANSFLGLSAIKYLHLANNQIEAIQRFTFDTLRNTVEYIDLRHNKLFNVDELFDVLVGNNKLVIKLANNLWECNPPSAYLMNLRINYPDMFPDSICSDLSIDIECIDDDGMSETVTVSKGDVPIRVNNIENGSIEVEFEGEFKNHVILWFDQEAEQSNINCGYSDKKTVQINNLEPDKIYTICSMNRYKTSVTPFDCISYYNGVIPKAIIPWIFMDDKPLTIGLLVFVYLICFLAGPILMYLLFYFYPILLKGSEGVIIVRSKSEIQLKNEDFIRDHSTAEYDDSLFNSANQGNMYEPTINDKTNFERVKWQLDRAQVIQHGNQYYLEKLPIGFAPAPPSHTKESTLDKISHQGSPGRDGQRRSGLEPLVLYSDDQISHYEESNSDTYI